MSREPFLALYDHDILQIVRMKRKITFYLRIVIGGGQKKDAKYVMT